MNIKVYEKMSYIYTFDDKVYPTPMPVKDLEKLLNWANRFINLWSDLIAVSSIKRVEAREIDNVENYILQISDRELRERLQNEVSKRKKEWMTTNLQILQNIIERLTS